MTDDKRYNGWTNYETWAVKLWMDNDQGSYEYWQERTRDAWRQSGPKYPNAFVEDHEGNARILLAGWLKDEHDDDSEHPVFKAAEGTVYSDLLSAALSKVNWYEIAQSLLDDLSDDDKATEDEESSEETVS